MNDQLTCSPEEVQAINRAGAYLKDPAHRCRHSYVSFDKFCAVGRVAAELNRSDLGSFGVPLNVRRVLLTLTPGPTFCFTNEFRGSDWDALTDDEQTTLCERMETYAP